MKLLFMFAVVAMAGPLKLGEIDNKDLDTPICTVWSTNQNQVGHVTYFAEPHDSAALVVVNGQRIELGLNRGQRSLWDYQTTGEVISTKYQAGPVAVEFRGVVKQACDQGIEGCEQTRLSIDKMIVKSGSDFLELEYLFGSCGV